MAPIVTEFNKSNSFSCSVAVTGQHREMLDQVNMLFGIEPEFDLNILQQGQSLSQILSRTLTGLDEILAKSRPDVVLVQGDTTSSTAASIAAFYAKIPVVHVEAGLRSFDIKSPFPEEANRKLTSQVTALHLAPTSISKKNLIAEGVSEAHVVVTGNSVIDALLHAVDQRVPFNDPRIAALTRANNKVMLVTAHRRENQGAGMESVGRALARIAREEPTLSIVLPIHKNPVVRDAILPNVAGLENVIITEPMDYGEFTHLISLSDLVLTDSGGIQEEAPSLGKPVLVMRDNTERPEAVSAGTVKLVGTDEGRIVEEVRRLLHDRTHYDSMATVVNPYGDGLAAARTVAAVSELLGIGSRLHEFAL